jgi:hypothetical protein
MRQPSGPAQRQRTVQASNRSGPSDERRPDSCCRIDLYQAQDTLLAMTGPLCPLCDDTGLVCEAHQDQRIRPVKAALPSEACCRELSLWTVIGAVPKSNGSK